MGRREAAFGVLAIVLVALYSWGWSRLGPLAPPDAASSPTARPTSPPEQTGVPRVPGTIAFGLAGDIYLLRDGRYAPVTSEGRNSQPALSPDGVSVYFARQESIDGARVYEGARVSARLAYTSIVRKPAAGGAEQVLLDGLTQRSASGLHAVTWYLGPAVSPDGRRLAVTADDGDGFADLALVTLPQGAARPQLQLLSRGAELADPAWSPDGDAVAVTTYNTDVPGILVWDLAKPGTAERLDGFPDGEPYRPSYSPDGEWILYTLRHDGRSDVHAFEAATGRDVTLSGDGRSWAAVFSPDGEWIAFLRERDGTIDLYAMQLKDALSGGAPAEAVKLTRGEGVDGSSRPSWSR